MSFGGSVSAMLVSLKNNKIPKRERKLGHLEYKDGVHIGPALKFKNQLSTHQMEAFKENLAQKKRKAAQRTILIYIVTLISVAIIVTYKVGAL